MPRLLPDWLQSYLEFTAEQESPDSFHLWTAIATLSAAVRRKLCLRMTYGEIYPNIYVIMVAESAKVRKSSAANFGRKILLDAFADINIMQDSMTSQALTKSMNHKTQVIKDNTIAEEQRSDVAIFADEVANLFSYDKMRAAYMTIFLTRTYECPDVYDHNTVRDSKIRLHNLYPVLVGCTDPKNLKTIPEEAADGLMGRLIWIIESERRVNNSGWQRDASKSTKTQLIREMLIKDLQEIGRLQGEMHADDSAMNLYDAWYEALTSRDGRDPISDAFYHRCHATVLRIAMLLSISTSDSLMISTKNMQGAITLIEQQLPATRRVGMWTGSSTFEMQRAKYINYLIQQHGVTTRRALLKHMGLEAGEFDRVTATLNQDGTIEIPTMKVKNEVVIRLRTASQTQ